jgi:hypothetical protein
VTRFFFHSIFFSSSVLWFNIRIKQLWITLEKEHSLLSRVIYYNKASNPIQSTIKSRRAMMENFCYYVIVKEPWKHNEYMTESNLSNQVTSILNW